MGLEDRDGDEFLILTDVSLEIEELKKLKAIGNYEEGARVADALYERTKAGFVEDYETTAKDLLLMEIIDLGGWMQYARVESDAQKDTADCMRWRDRAQEVRSRLAAVRKELERQGQTRMEFRAAMAVADARAGLQRIRSGWKLGQFHTQGDEQHAAVCGAIEEADQMVDQGKIVRSADTMGQTLRRTPDYVAAVTDARRMKGVMTGLSYIWRRDFQMADHDAAERTLPDSEVYAQIVVVAEGILKEFIGRHPYADYEQIRYFKMTGRYLEALERAQVIMEKPEKAGDMLYIARLANIIAELKMILAEQILSMPPDSERRGKFESQGIAAVKNMRGINPVALQGLRGAPLAHTLLQHAFRDVAEVIEIQDRPTARTLQNTLLDIGNDILELRQEDSGSMRNRVAQIQRAFRPELVEYGDDAWIFQEAPLLAEFWVIAAGHDINIDFVREIDPAHFRRARSRFAAELEKRNRTNNIPPAYFNLLRKKHTVIHTYLARSR